MEDTGSHSSGIPELLVENHRRFLSFLTPRVGNAADAEEILQAAFVKSVEKSGSILDEESVVAWFYRLLRNSVVDHFRQRDTERRALERLAAMDFEADVPEPECERAICRCVTNLLPTLPDDYSTLLRQVDLEGASIAEISAATGLTPNNSRVKLHRARKALRKQVQRSCGSCAEHGCLDCNCRRPV